MELLKVGIFLLIAAFFEGSETAFVSINRINLHSKLESKQRSAKMLEKLTKNSESVIGTFLIVANGFIIAAVIAFTNFMTSQLGNHQFIPLYVSLILTPIILIFVSLIPKVIFREFADSLIYPLSYFYYIVYILLYPIQFLFVNTVKILLGAVGLRKRKGSFSKDEFNILLDMTAERGMLKESEREFIESIMNFKNIKVKEIMVPLIRMTCVEENDTVEIASALMLSTRHSRIPVFRMRVDNMIGYVENKTLIDANKHDKVGKYVKESVFVPDMTALNNMLVMMQSKRSQMAFVVDEYGGVAGAVTNQDIIAEIIGEFVEIHEDWIQKEGDSYIVNASMNIDELNEELKLKIEKIEFETVAGFILHRLGHIPEAGEQFDEGRFSIEVVSASNVRVKRIKISPKKKKEKKRGTKLNAG